jgi:hypothetical protein
MSENNKIIVSVDFNRQSIQASKEDVKAFGEQLKQLVAHITAANSALANLGKATGATATTNGQTGLPKAPTVSGIPSSSGGGGGSGGGASRMADTFRESTAAVKTFSDTLRDSLSGMNQARTQMDQLTGAAQKLSQAAATIKTSSFSTSGFATGAPTIQTPPPNFNTSGAPTVWSQVKSVLNRPIDIEGTATSAVQGVLNRFGLPPEISKPVSRLVGSYGLPILAADMTYRAANWVAEQYDDERKSELDWKLNEPLRKWSRAAATAQPFNRLFNAARGRDFSYIAAYNETANDKQLMKTIGSTALINESVLQKMDQGSSGGAMVRQWWGGLKGDASKTVGDFMAWATKSGGLQDGTQSNKIQQELWKAQMDVQPELAAKFQTAVENRNSLTGPFKRMAYEEYANAEGRLALARQARIQLGDMDVVDVASGKTIKVDRLTREKNLFLSKTGRSLEEGAAAGHRLASTAGQAFFGAGRGNWLLGMEEGGLQGIPEFMRQAMSLGGTRGSATGAVSALQHTVGKGGMDATLGSRLAAEVMQMASRTGQLGGTDAGISLMQQIAGFSSGGEADVGEQQRRMELATRGFGAMDRYGNKGSGLYQATSMMSAMEVTGGYGAASRSLAAASGTTLAALAGGGEIPAYYKALGLTQEHFKKQFDAQYGQAPGFEVVDELVGDNRAGALWKKVRETQAEGGTIFDAIRSMAKTPKEQQAIAEELGGVINAANPEEGASILVAGLTAGTKRLTTARGVNTVKADKKTQQTIEGTTEIGHKTAAEMGEIKPEALNADSAANAANRGIKQVKDGVNDEATASLGKFSAILDTTNTLMANFNKRLAEAAPILRGIK